MSLLKRQNGFTFNELLVAMGLSFVALLSYAFTSAGVFRDQKAIDNLTIAMHLAEDKIEELMAPKNIAIVDNCPNGGNAGIGSNGMTPGIFNRCWTVTVSAAATALKRIDVTVAWQDHKAQSFRLSTLVYQEP